MTSGRCRCTISAAVERSTPAGKPTDRKKHGVGMSRISLMMGAVLFAACSETVAGPSDDSLCSTNQGLEVCADRREYSPADDLTASVRNAGTESVFVDACSIKVVGKTSRTAKFATDYSPSIQCGSDVDMTEIVASMVEVPAGQTRELMIKIPTFAFQGFYRVNVWILDASGERVSSLPVFSGTFDVFPSAGN
jgi:hypothetical protein